MNLKAIGMLETMTEHTAIAAAIEEIQSTVLIVRDLMPAMEASANHLEKACALLEGAKLAADNEHQVIHVETPITNQSASSSNRTSFALIAVAVCSVLLNLLCLLFLLYAIGMMSK